MIPIINQGFTNKDGKYYDKVREIAFKKGQLQGNVGKFVAETQHENNLFGEDSTGIYLYQSFHDPNIAYRIYKEFADYRFNGHGDDVVIQKLMEKQDLIKMSKFPTGVVTLDGFIIGQEVPYFIDCIPLNELFKNNKKANPMNVYRAIISVLKELSDNGIIYMDNHPKNFLINPNDKDLKINIIDFERHFMSFDEEIRPYSIKKQFENLKNMLNILNELNGIETIFLQTDNFEDLSIQIDEMEKKLKKKI